MNISGRALAHLICLERLTAHALVCKEKLDQCERSQTLQQAFVRTFEKLHPREQRRFKPIADEMGRKIFRARSPHFS